MASTLAGLPLLVHLSGQAHAFGCHVGEWRGVTSIDLEAHSANSYHRRLFPGTTIGRAFDVTGSVHARWRFVTHLQRAGHLPHLAEAIYNGRITKISWDQGARVPYPDFWGLATWLGHRNHVHVAA